MLKRAHIFIRLVLCCLALTALALPAAAQQIKRDVDYRVIPQQPVASGDKIEVIDFFWYGCPYCNEMQPHLERWRKNMPADVVLRRMPVVRHDNWGPHARIYYALETLSEVERLQLAVYHGYHVEDLYMSKPDVMLEWATKHGIDREKWLAAYNAPDMAQKIQRAKDLTKNYDIQGTPSLVVDGRYLTSTSMTPSVGAIIPVLDGLIRLARQDRLQKSGK
jgi:thiol:disulfide interchange protein DsbA